jgi:hypothetical protein
MGLLSKAASKGATLLDTLTSYHLQNPVFQGIVLESSTGKGNEFYDQVAAMTSSFALVRPLPSGRCLVLFPKSKDRFLISHRLAKTLNTAAHLTFEAQDPQGALRLLKPYL